MKTDAVAKTMTVETSIIVRTFNEEKHLGNLFDGFDRQTYRDFEVFVVDSGNRRGIDRSIDEDLAPRLTARRKREGQAFAPVAPPRFDVPYETQEVLFDMVVESLRSCGKRSVWTPLQDTPFPARGALVRKKDMIAILGENALEA